MKRLLTIALTAAALGGAVLSTAAPAEARDWGGRGGHGDHDRGGRGDHDRGDRGDRGRGGWSEHEGWRDRGGWRGHDRDWGDGWRFRSGGYYYGFGSRCHSEWRWNPYWGRNVRVTRCY